MGLKPQRLQLGVTVFLVGEPVVLQDVVHFSEVSKVKSHNCPGPQNTLRLVQLLHVRMGHGQRPEEPSQSLDISALLQSLADGRYLERELCTVGPTGTVQCNITI